MHLQPTSLSLALASALSLTLAACGGGGSGEAGSADTFMLPGTAATGAPYPDDSSVTVIDAAGTTFSGKVTGGSGAYAVAVKKTAQAPFVLQVSADDLPTLVSISTDAQPTRVNVTPITHLIAATLSPSGNPLNLATEIKDKQATVNAALLGAKKNAVIENILQPVNTALGDSTDPISGAFEIGAGHDLVLEALKIQVMPTSDNASTVSVSLKTANPVDMAPIALGQGASLEWPKLADTLTEKSGSSSLDKSQLAGDGLPTQIAALLGRMTACHALPVTARIKPGGTAAADITAEACRSLFVGQDPSLFRHNSHPVSSTGAFMGIFSSSAAAQGIKFTLPSFEYKVRNGNTTDPTKPQDGDVVFTARWVDGDGHSNVEEYWARPDAQGQLFLTGNLSPLDIEVSPRAELREFPNLTGKNFYNTGYNLFIHGKHAYAKAVVTSPKGTQITLQRVAGLDFFVIAKDGAPTGTSMLRLAGAYADPAASGTPRADFASLVWAGAADTPDRDITALPLQGTWTFDFYSKASDTTPAVSGVRRRTLQRAPSLGELRSASWPALTAGARKDIQAQSGTLGYIQLDGGGAITVATGDKDDQPAWEVPAGAWSPLKLTAFGRSPDGTQAFNDSARVKASARLATIVCSSAGPTDTHCGPQSGTYAPDSRLTAINFSGRDSRRVTMTYVVDFRGR